MVEFMAVVEFAMLGVHTIMLIRVSSVSERKNKVSSEKFAEVGY